MWYILFLTNAQKISVCNECLAVIYFVKVLSKTENFYVYVRAIMNGMHGERHVWLRTKSISVDASGRKIRSVKRLMTLP